MLHETISWMEKNIQVRTSINGKVVETTPCQNRVAAAAEWVKQEMLMSCFFPCFPSASSYLISYLGPSCWFSWLALSHHTEDLIVLSFHRFEWALSHSPVDRGHQLLWSSSRSHWTVNGTELIPTDTSLHKVFCARWTVEHHIISTSKGLMIAKTTDFTAY